MQAKKRALPKQLLDATEAFKTQAGEFQQKAAEIKNGNISTNVTNFKDAARNFKNAGTNFKIVGNLLYELAQIISCEKVRDEASGFQNQATLFKQKADLISISYLSAEDEVETALEAFDSAIGNFQGAAGYFETFAQSLTTSVCTTDLRSLANQFKITTEYFESEAIAFHVKAQLIDSDAQENIGKIKDEFQKAAQEFGKGSDGAAHKFYDAIKALAYGFQLLATASDESCELLKTHANEFANAVDQFKNQAKEFSDAANTFQGQATAFQSAADTIPDITTEVTISKETLTRASKVQDAITIFKLAASVFGGDDGATAKFEEFAKELEKATPGQGTNCYKLFGMIEGLKGKAKEFKNKSNGFLQAAGEFSQQSGDTATDVTNFKAMATKFREASDKLKDLADALAAAYANETGLKDKAEAFKDKAVEFHRYAERFEVAAQLVTDKDQADLNKVKDSFATGSGNFAHHFGNDTEGAAAKLHNAFQAFTDALTSGDCDELTSAAKAFKLAVDTPGGQGFKHLADGFQEKANEIEKNSELNDNTEAKKAINAFQEAAKKFGDQDGDDTVAGKLSAFATALNDKASQNCYKLLMHADKFQKASANFTVYAQLFRTAATAFKARADAFKTSAGPWTLIGAATAFLHVARYFKQLADNLASDLSGTELATEANDFRDAVDAFYNDSRLFYYSAQQVTTSNGLDDPRLKDIKEKFQQAATAFNNAAEQFYSEDPGKVAGAFDDFANQLQSASQNCETLQQQAGEFTRAARGFKEKAGEFRSQVESIKDITVEVTYLTGITVGGQQVTTDTKTIKPSMVQLAISQFKSSAAKFHKYNKYTLLNNHIDNTIRI